MQCCLAHKDSIRKHSNNLVIIMNTSRLNILKIKGEQKLQISFITSDKKYVQCNLNDDQLSRDLCEKKQTSINSLKNIEVEFEEENGQPIKVREKGKEWDRLDPIAKNNPISSNERNTALGDFHNPYNFVPALTRDKITGDLGDRHPSGHGSYISDHWSGRISVTLTTVTPLLIPDAANAEGTDHKTYPIRKGADNKPYLPPTSIKGMLRSAYESVTNSRLSIFQKHENRLAYRMAAKLGALPARVESKGEKLFLRIMEETSLIGCAAKLPRYQQRSRQRDKGESTTALKYEGSQMLPQHGEAVWVCINNKSTVTRIQKYSATRPTNGDWRKGWVCITGANINGKKNERVFVEDDGNERILVTDEMKSLWSELISNYQSTHVKDLENRHKRGQRPQDYLGDKPGETAWSRHVFISSESDLKKGTLCYVEIDDDGEVTALFPVSISRRLYTISPDKLLPKSLHPTKNIADLSPADRVFGWVRQNKDEKDSSANGAYKGQLRIGQSICQRHDAIEDFGTAGFPLAILGQPQPQQARFYAARDKSGNPFAENTNKESTYHDSSQGLRGRKVYPHHKDLPENYWDDPTINAGQEYRRPDFIKDGQDKTRDDQNRSIQAWVKPQTEFKFSIDVANLSSVELGALLWLLSLPESNYHRLGGGKPLGFGSVRLDINWQETDLRLGDEWRDFYLSLADITKPHQNLKQVLDQQCIQVFKNQANQAYSSSNFEQISFVAAFLQCARGFDDNLPIHYPRLEGKSFEWFVENERTGRNGGKKVSLPKLVSDHGLPRNPKV